MCVCVLGIVHYILGIPIVFFIFGFKFHYDKYDLPTDLPSYLSK